MPSNVYKLPRPFMARLLQEFVALRRTVGMGDDDIRGQLFALGDHTKVPSDQMDRLVRLAFQEPKK